MADNSTIVTNRQARRDYFIIETFEAGPEQILDFNINIPVGKNVRVLKIEGYPITLCGGTHVQYLAELGSIKITNIKSKKGHTKISYKVE